jgi:hypothetical protein
MKPKIDYLVKDLKIPADVIPKMIMQQPSIFGYSVDLMDSKIIFFEKQGLSRSYVINMFRSSPSLFGLTIDDSLQPKLKFLLKKGFVTEDKSSEGLASVPGFYFGYSLHHRIGPRLYFIKHVTKIGGALNQSDTLFATKHEDAIKAAVEAYGSRYKNAVDSLVACVRTMRCSCVEEREAVKEELRRRIGGGGDDLRLVLSALDYVGLEAESESRVALATYYCFRELWYRHEGMEWLVSPSTSEANLAGGSDSSTLLSLDDGGAGRSDISMTKI